jgi:spermidine synthase|tara:strand:- start:469 stop:1206 length:738 start_codon:yes stop_codon:yes gene_type:complete
MKKKLMKTKNIYYEHDDTSGTSIGVKYEKYLYNCQSKFQSIEVVKTLKYGNALYLDGCFMLSETNQDYYHNTCLNLTTKKSKNILIIGGGDYAIASMLVRRNSNTKITIVEIDEKVVQVSKKYFPKHFKLTKGQLKNIKLVLDNGMTFLKHDLNKYDCIIIDSTDPVGQAKILYSKNFIKLCNAALIKGGTLIQQSGSPINDMKSLIKPLVKKYDDIGMKKIILSSFPMPLYPTGTWSFISAKRA